MNTFLLRASEFQDRVELPQSGAPANNPKWVKEMEACGDMIEYKMRKAGKWKEDASQKRAGSGSFFTKQEAYDAYDRGVAEGRIKPIANTLDNEMDNRFSQRAADMQTTEDYGHTDDEFAARASSSS